jgi:hypothetical protein
MAGVYTDNQPDFSFLQPGETKTWSQYWYPIREIGPAQHANLEGAVSLRRVGGKQTASIQIGVAVTAVHPKARVTVERVLSEVRRDGGVRPQAAARKTLARFTCDLAPGRPLVRGIRLPRGVAEPDLRLRVTDGSGRELIGYAPRVPVQDEVPPPATEPPAPAEIASADELYLTACTWTNIAMPPVRP